jgi:hypothetical protein
VAVSDLSKKFLRVPVVKSLRESLANYSTNKQVRIKILNQMFANVNN